MGSPTSASYYSFEPHKDWRFIVLDGYDVSMLGWPEGHPHHEQARAALESRNPNKVGFHSGSIARCSQRGRFDPWLQQSMMKLSNNNG